MILNSSGVSSPKVHARYHNTIIRYIDYYFRKEINRNEGLLTGVTNALGVKQAINYSPLTEGSTIYTKDEAYADVGEDGRVGEFEYVKNIVAPLYVVSSFSSSNGIGGINTVKYEYKGAKIHTQGKGFLGFREKVVTNKTTGTITTITQKLDTDYYTFLPYSTEVKHTNDTLISQAVQDISLDKIKESNHRYKTTLNSLTETNGLQNTSVQKKYVFDEYGNLKNLKTYFFNGNTQLKNYEEQIIIYTKAGAWCNNKPSYRRIIKFDENGNEYRRTKMEYDKKGNLIEEIIDPNRTNTKTIEYQGHDVFGNPKYVKTTASGETRTVEYVYTESGKFVEQEKIVKQEEDGVKEFITTYTYDEEKGLMLSETDYLGLTTKYEYDGMGRPKKTIYPDGKYAVSLLQWAVNSDLTHAKYCKYTAMAGASPVWVWYDALGRELRSESYGFYTTKKIRKEREYNAQGQLSQTFKPYFEGGERSSALVYGYDDYGRLITESSDLYGTTTTTYPKKGDLTKTVTTPRGEKKETFNAAGQLLTSTVDGRSVSYTYWPSGRVKTATPEEGKAVETFYDIQGNRTKLIDPDAGTIENEYNGFGEMVWQKHTKSKLDGTKEVIKTIYGYDGLGKLEHVTVDGKKTKYNYTDQGFLVSTVSEDHEIHYRYDEGRNLKMGLVTSYTEKVNGKDFTFRTEYDAFGREKKRTYPSGFYTTNEYNLYGHLTEVKERGGASVWKAEGVNVFGQLTQTRKGNKVTKFAYDEKHRPFTIVAEGIIEQQYDFADNGNLSRRRCAVYGQYESFDYDSHNQLVGGEVYDWDHILGTRLYYDLEYDKRGNITSKSDIGYEMVYDHSTKTNALTGIKGNPSLISDDDQVLTYTNFNKVHTLTEGDKSLALTYGVDHQRRLGEFKTGSGSFKRYYLGDYEEDHRSGKTKKVHYISGGDGLAAIYIEENGSSKLYYAYTDYLGSLTALTDRNGNVVERYSYDAWGNRRNPENWQQKDTCTSFIVDRGYTMHEHLDGFALINMNGRVYDPQVGRFISPDPHIQTGDYWLNYNRYAYCYNNPFKYKDPTGEFIFTTVAFIFDFMKTAFLEGGLDFTSRETMDNAWQNFDPTANWSITTQAAKLDWGIVRNNVSKWFYWQPDASLWEYMQEFRSKVFNTEVIQSSIGYVFSAYKIITGDVEAVGYYEDRTTLRLDDDGLSMGRGISLGRYVLGEGMALNPDDTAHDLNLFYHEFGHTYQSRIAGHAYLFKYGIPSAAGSERPEQDADIRAHKKFGVWPHQNYRPGTYGDQNNIKWWELHPIVYPILPFINR